VTRTINCPACGTKTDARRRKRCPRCRAELVVAAQPSAPGSARTRSNAPIAIACIVGLIVTAGVVIRIGTSAEPVASASTSATKPSVPRPSAAVEAPAGGDMRPSSVATSMDLSRGGLAAYARGDVAGSVAQFTAAVEADPSNAQALNNLGQALVRSGRAREAIPYFDRAVTAASTEWTYHFNRAKAYGELQEWGRAVAGYRDAARLFPDDYATAFNLARALQASGDMSAAIDEYQRAINLAPGEADFPLALASALEIARRPGDAVKAYQRYLELQDSGATAEKVRRRIQELESR
jgi:tetratricopeptide (TPR) repeat protein